MNEKQRNYTEDKIGNMQGYTGKGGAHGRAMQGDVGLKERWGDNFSYT